jgi:hypothetical protein
MKFMEANELLLILLGISGEGEQCQHWFDAICLNDEDLSRNPDMVSSAISSIKSTNPSSVQMIVRVWRGLLRFQISVLPH